MYDYVVGYYNKPWAKDDFVIMAITDSKSVAMFVRDSYNESYEKNGMSVRLIILASHEVPRNHRFAK